MITSSESHPFLSNELKNSLNYKWKNKSQVLCSDCTHSPPKCLIKILLLTSTWAKLLLWPRVPYLENFVGTVLSDFSVLLCRRDTELLIVIIGGNARRTMQIITIYSGPALFWSLIGRVHSRLEELEPQSLLDSISHKS